MAVMIHEEIDSYIRKMKFFMVWYGKSVPWNDTLYDRCRKFHTNTKWILITVMFFIENFLLYPLEGFGLLDGYFLYWLVCWWMMAIHCIERFSGGYQDEVTMSLNEHFLENTEPWMAEVRDKYISSLRKYLKLYHLFNIVTGTGYLFAPLVVDTILHYGFDYLDRPFCLIMPLSPLLKDNYSWNLSYYVITAINIWFTGEVVLAIRWYIANFSLQTTFFLTELVILKEQVKALNLEDESSLGKQVKFIVSRHSKIIKLNGDLKNYLGLSGAFTCLFSSLAITLTGFTMYLNTNIPLGVSYGSGFVLYSCSVMLFCIIGQELENEVGTEDNGLSTSDELFNELYGLPWYRFSPSARRSLHMMMIQSRTNPLTIDCHGYFTMNLAGFAEILKSSYSYFTLLQSLSET